MVFILNRKRCFNTDQCHKMLVHGGEQRGYVWCSFKIKIVLFAIFLPLLLLKGSNTDTHIWIMSLIGDNASRYAHACKLGANFKISTEQRTANKKMCKRLPGVQRVRKHIFRIRLLV